MSSIDFAQIKALVEEREALLNSGPPEQQEMLRTLQGQIDEQLAKAGKRNRLPVIASMMFESLERLNLELARLRMMTGGADEAE